MDINTLNVQLTYLENTKEEIKQVLINKGQTINIDDTFRSYVNKIDNLTDTSDGTITANDVMENKIAYSNIGRIVGEFSLNTELETQDNLLQTQVTNIDNIVSALENKIATGLQEATSDANATADDIMYDKTAYVNGSKLTGTLNLDTEIANQTALITQLEELVQSKSVIQPVFENGNMSSLNSAVADVIKPVIQAFTDYLDELQEQNVPYLDEPITIYTPDENMQYFIIHQMTNNTYRIIWSKSKYAGLQHSSTSQYLINCLGIVGVRTVTDEINIHNADWNWSIYGSGIDTNWISKNDTYKSNTFSTMQELINAISNPNSDITYTHAQNTSSFGSYPSTEYIGNIFLWENSVSAVSKVLDTIVTTKKLSNNVTILPLNS